MGIVIESSISYDFADFESAEILLVSLPVLSVAIGATTVKFDVMCLEGW